MRSPRSLVSEDFPDPILPAMAMNTFSRLPVREVGAGRGWSVFGERALMAVHSSGLR